MQSGRRAPRPSPPRSGTSMSCSPLTSRPPLGHPSRSTEAEANRTAQEFARAKIREIVRDPVVAEALCPSHTIGTKRTCVDIGYFETYNRANVELVDVRRSPIEAITPRGVATADAEHPVDVIVFAIGFDAMTGALLEIDIRGRDGVALRDAWAHGPRTLLG